MAREVSSIAPWAEIVPEAPYPMSVEEFERWPEEPGWRYELIDGRLVRMPGPGGQHGEIALRIGAALRAYVAPHRLGRVLGESTYRLLLPGATERIIMGPDTSFVARGRGPVPGTPEYERPWEVTPDLAVEIASPDQYRPAMGEKANRYLLGGTRLVWVVYPRWQEIDVWRPSKPVQTLHATDQVDGLDVLPGFTYPVAAFFPALDEE